MSAEDGLMFDPLTGGDEMSERFTMGAETFTAASNGKMWTRSVSEPMTWAAAHAYAAACRVGGHKDWRVPEVGELWSLVDHSTHSPATWPELRDCTPVDWFWASTPYAPASGYAWFVYFYNGNAGSDGVIATGRVRCVRGGER